MPSDQARGGGVRTALLLACAVLVAVVVVAAAAFGRGLSSGRGTRPGSSFRADESGSLAARLVLEDLGYDVASRRGARLPRGRGHVLIRIQGLEAVAASPAGPGLAGFTPDAPVEEIQAAWSELAEWIADGNALLLCAGSQPEATAFPSVVPLADAPLEVGDLTATGDGTLDELFGADRVRVPATEGSTIEEEHVFDDLGDPWISGRTALAADAEDDVLATSADASGGEVPVVLARAFGDGQAIVVADPFFLSNVRLAAEETDNAAWLAVLVERIHGGGTVVFDDRAVGQTASRGVLSLLEERGLGPALLGGLFVLLLAWWRLGPGDAPDRRVRVDPVYAPESFALLRADLYAHCLAGADVRAMVHAEVVRRVARGDALSCERALDLLATRDPAGAERVRAALVEMPRHDAVTVRRYPELWSQSVARVWRALEEVGHHGREIARSDG